ncbi:MAG: ATP-binding protein [Sulfurimonas sp.]|uniref:ATP-binding protein n=1 Tax=Sulfurimonas sp. TaxID=2022749 RepID=UPI00262698FE|nr:ATP-binding protein [Sulfurimonas sp.]MDD2651979.1 ATP-binding protein [Sulfurimonas sp.]MDD3451895.1 ATP-binding protein [Sulfurimonas sp.]
MFINRKDELQALENEYSKKNASFSVIYGRRRVGKTALIGQYIQNKPHFYFYATESNLDGQLEKFVKEILKLSALPYASNLSFKNFEEVFEFISTLKLEKKLIIAIDEYQNLCYLDKSFSSVLQKSWDMHLSKSNIHLILCGSVFSMMHSEVLAYNAPLYGRRTTNIHLKAIKFRYLREFLPGMKKTELMEIYASFGTIPKYLQMYEKNKSFEQNIVDNILDKNSYLYSEGNFLLKQEISDAGSYFAILESISKGNTKVGDIAKDLKLHSSYLPKYLGKLIELDILEKEVPVTESNPLKSKLGRYKIKDKFLNFWFYYVYKNYNYLEINQTEQVLQEIKLNFNDRFVSFAFEDVIHEEILLEPLKYLEFIPTKIGRWWSNKEEIDLVAFDDENICFIECKWRNKVDKKKVEQQLINKSIHLKDERRRSFLVITKEEFEAQK